MKKIQTGKNVNVLLAVYNGQRFIEEQIESIINQSYPNTHLIVRDNASSDDTVDIVFSLQKRYPGRVELIQSKTNDGIIGNFSALLEQSKADYVMFSDHDDVWLENKVEKTLDKMIDLEKKNPDSPLLVHTDLKVVDQCLNEVSSSFWAFSGLNPKKGQTLSRLLIQNQVTGCTMMMNRALVNLVGKISNNCLMHDWWIALHAAAFGRIDTVDEPLILYRQHQSNDTGAKKYSLLNIAKTRFDNNRHEKVKKNRSAVLGQAQSFLEKNSFRLTGYQKKTLEAFCLLDQVNWNQRLKLVYRFGFYRTGFWRNLCLVLGISKS